MKNGYKRVSGNSNIAFDYPLRALVISNEETEPGFDPEISMYLNENPILVNWMYIRKNK